MADWNIIVGATGAIVSYITFLRDTTEHSLGERDMIFQKHQCKGDYEKADSQLPLKLLSQKGIHVNK